MTRRRWVLIPVDNERVTQVRYQLEESDERFHEWGSGLEPVPPDDQLTHDVNMAADAVGLFAEVIDRRADMASIEIEYDGTPIKTDDFRALRDRLRARFQLDQEDDA